MLLYNKIFQDVSDGKVEMFGAFFSAIKSYISEITLTGSKELKTIELGDYFIFTTLIPDAKSDLVIIADKEDYKLIKKIFPKIIKIVLNHKELFIEWRANVNEFLILDKPLTDLIYSKKKLVSETDSSFFEDLKKILKSFLPQKKEVSEKIEDNLVKEKDYLASRLKRVNNYFQRLTIIEKLIELNEKVKDHDELIKNQEEAMMLRDIIKDAKIKLDFFMKKVKRSLSEAISMLGAKSLQQGDYKDTYLNLFSFSQKLTNLSTSKTKSSIQDLARKLSNKETLSDKVLSEAISNILNLSDNIEEYFDYS